MVFVAMICFVLFNYVGDPIDIMSGQESTQEMREALRERLGLNDPAPVQFFRFIGNALQGNFGISYRLKRPVEVLIAERLPATLELVLFPPCSPWVSGFPPASTPGSTETPGSAA
jgi:peptide/nickel transport system permease protein